MSDTLKFTLKYPLTQEDYNLITDAEFEHSDTIWFVTPKGKSVEFRKVVKGEWIKSKDPMSIYITCSACGAMTIGRYNYCSNCGARMVDE